MGEKQKRKEGKTKGKLYEINRAKKEEQQQEEEEEKKNIKS